MRRRFPIHSVHIPQVLPLLLIALVARAATINASAHGPQKKVASIVESLKKHLGITNTIQIKIVENNPLGLSVERSVQRPGDFLLLIDAHFLNRLDDEELKAALAHELGHVWIYTHHPYLQTEALANRIAMRAVTRNSLKKLYTELAAFEGTPSDVDKLLGTEPPAAVKTGTAKQ
jgi:hypothetical protein